MSPDGERPGKAAMKSVLLFRIGSIGDTLMAVPAMWAVREHFAGAIVTLLCDFHPKKRYVLASDLLRGSGLYDDVLLYPVDNSPAGRLWRPLRMARLLATLRRRRFDALAYLVPTGRPPEAVERDRRFFRLAGIEHSVGFEGDFVLRAKAPGRPLARMPHEAEMLLARLAASGIRVPSPGEWRTDLGLGETEEREVAAWLEQLPGDVRRPWVSVGPGAKKPVCVWPAERYEAVVRTLIAEFGVWPVVFGGAEDRAVGERLLEAWGCGYSAAGRLGLRATMVAMRRCRLHVGNDTGTLHMAAAVGVPCVAISPSRCEPGLWDPYGEMHRVLRTPIDCEGCYLVECIERRMECILSITVEAALDACRSVLRATRADPASRAVPG